MTGIQSYIAALEDAFHAAAARCGETATRSYRIAGHMVHVAFAGRSLLPILTPALEHLAVEPGDEEGLRILAWDQASATTAMPTPPWSWQSYRSRGEIGGLDPVRFRVWYHLASGILSIVDLVNRRAFQWLRDSRDVPVYVVAAPFRMILNAWLNRSGLHFAHAAAVGTEAGGLLMAGPSGSGKSATSLACLEAAMDFLGDDYCIVAARPEARVHSVYCSAKTDDEMLKNLPGLLPSRQRRNDPPGEKALLLLRERHAERLVSSRRLLAFLAPTVCDQRYSTLEPVKALIAVRALAPTTMEQVAGPDASAWETILSLAGQLPCYRLRLGHDIGSTAPLLSGLIAELSEGSQ